MSTAEEINADMLSFWNGQGGRTWTQRQAHTDTTLQPVTDALLAFAGPVNGDLVLDVGCGCGAPTLDFARAVGPSGRIVAIDISAPMLAVGKARAEAAGLTNIEWQEADPSTAPLDEYDLLTSAFGSIHQHAQVRGTGRQNGNRLLALAC
jgi:SAM-dependent methyltransferase